MKNYQFYHMYPLGMLKNQTIPYLHEFIPHLTSMNINGIYLGPVFSSVHHGYDTIDYLKVDQRLGSNDDLYEFIQACHHKEIHVILDCVFNHVSREFFAFQDVLEHKQNSNYRHWFNLDFNRNNKRNDGFSYDTWDGHDDLVKLNLRESDVITYLLDVATKWVEWFDIDGLRLDAADVMDREFIRRLTVNMRQMKKDFFIVGEMVHGDYSKLIQETGIDSVTNYEAYKGLYSSLNDVNYFEIAHSFKRLLTNQGAINKHLTTQEPNKKQFLYNFVDNHDVNRIASVLKEERFLYPLYLMLYTMPGYTSLYYKSEFGAKGMRSSTSDQELRKPFILDEIDGENPIYQMIKRLSTIRKELPVLAEGTYEEFIVEHQLMGYFLSNSKSTLLVLINSSSNPIVLNGNIAQKISNRLGDTVYDHLNNEKLSKNNITVYPNWGRILS